MVSKCSKYRKETHYSTTHRRRQNFYALPSAHQELLKRPPIDFLDNLSKIDDAIDNNADLADAILALALDTFGLPEDPEKGSEVDWHNTAEPLDMSKAHSTLRQFWRDWSSEGFNEELRGIRDLIESSLNVAKAHDARNTSKPNSDVQELPTYENLLLPGAGLGRLVFELCLLGHNTEGNEISYHQLLSSQFILNAVEGAGQFTLHPFINIFNNNISRSRQLKSVPMPDVHPGNVLAERMQQAEQSPGLKMPGQMSMTAGDFITSYSSDENADSFDGVITVYFIDTAPNVIRYLETIHHCLREGGVWINVGPLLWHFEDASHPHEEVDEDGTKGERAKSAKTGIAEPGSIELCEDEVLQLAMSLGFDLIHRSEPSPAVGGYIRDHESLMINQYRCCHWVFKKRAAV